MQGKFLEPAAHIQRVRGSSSRFSILFLPARKNGLLTQYSSAHTISLWIMMTIHPDTALFDTITQACRPKQMESVVSTIHNIDLPGEEQRHKMAYSIKNVLNEDECSSAIKICEKHGFEPATINAGVQILATDYRNSFRCIIDSPRTALLLWKRIRASLPEAFFQGETQAVGLNERLRFLRYSPGDYFAPHYDGAFRRNNSAGEREGEISKATIMIYLNDGFEGGKTDFPHPRATSSIDVDVAYTPEGGSALIFDHKVLHAGAPVTKGTKYAIRTDIMFTSNGSGHDYETKPILMPAKGITTIAPTVLQRLGAQKEEAVAIPSEKKIAIKTRLGALLESHSKCRDRNFSVRRSLFKQVKQGQDLCNGKQPQDQPGR